jgi:hypothetical protein
MKYSLQQLRIEVHQQWKKHGRPNSSIDTVSVRGGIPSQISLMV